MNRGFQRAVFDLILNTRGGNQIRSAKEQNLIRDLIMVQDDVNTGKQQRNTIVD
jgi:hypothetical protein